MATNEVFSKDALCKVIKANLSILHQCAKGSIYRQRTAILMLMLFIEYLLKYKIQCAGTYTKIHWGKEYPFPPTHEIDILYGKLTDGDQKCIEKWFSKLMKNRKPYSDSGSDSGSFQTVSEFASRFNTSYQFWRYEILHPNFKLDDMDEEYFYLSDTITVLRALIESTGLEIDPAAIPDEDILIEKILKKRVR